MIARLNASDPTDLTTWSVESTICVCSPAPLARLSSVCRNFLVACLGKGWLRVGTHERKQNGSIRATFGGTAGTAGPAAPPRTARRSVPTRHPRRGLVRPRRRKIRNATFPGTPPFVGCIRHSRTRAHPRENGPADAVSPRNEKASPTAPLSRRGKVVIKATSKIPPRR